MKLIVGLGNPGRVYINSRHNVGFLVIDYLAHTHRAALKKDRDTFSLTSRIKFEGQNVILAKPLTFMNLSGVAASGLVKKYKIDLNNLLVVCDDLDLDFTRLKIRPVGSSAGHNGLSSIIGSLESRNFSRLRLGIGRPPKFIDSAEYVLSSFSKREKGQLDNMIERAAACCQVWIREGPDKAMNIFNQRKA